ncbi:uncharacterized protein BP5553_03439 [Venustampulla echinocandica]|uniref:GPI anchored protein n=1 Tax=Venustampulla echinocandica TaxID=2656787 RepID=A0A370TUA4_9HELO|nr:uncharacterized protein BP5553_03439 [Venustampulla echinocandica]RDL39099.1 hypothetical protein BP5553_03439 [Venustampulla echinocandica]
MRLNSILFLPASILILIAPHTASADLGREEHLPTQWRRTIGAESLPRESVHRRRQVEEHLRLGRTPVGVMKMSPDEGEKFYMDYWQFEEDLGQSPSRDALKEPLRARGVEELRLLANGSTAVSFRPPFALHIGGRADNDDRWVPREIGGVGILAVLEKRASSCPTGTADCSSIGHPNSCCSTNENCFVIQDTGLGSVGCCPKGNSCGGTITHCNAPNSPCPANLGGGCCIPNYECEGVGCVFNSTVVVPQPPTTTASSSAEIPTSTTSSAIPPPTSATTTASSSPSLPNTPGTSTALSTASTDTGVAPVRPTSGTSITSTSSLAATPTDTLCPTGFYACSAYYQGGCCRVGRNCEKISCPATSSTTISIIPRVLVLPGGPAAQQVMGETVVRVDINAGLLVALLYLRVLRQKCKRRVRT